MVSSCSSASDACGEAAPALPTPAQIIKALDRFVIGQDRPKRDLAVAVYNHYLSLAYAAHPAARHKDLGPQHILLLGPTGSGKTYLVRRIAELLDVPIVFASATSLVEVGYKGESVDSLLESLISQCGGDTQKAERGIIYIDEFDKIRKPSVNLGRDVSGEGVQNALLTLLDGRRTTTGGYHTSKTTLDVSKILFICTGAFSELPQIVRSRIDGAGGFGFGAGRELARIEIESDDDAYAQGVHDDLIRYGFIPEIVGRFAAITALRTLSEDDLVRILTDAGDSTLEKQRTLFAIHGIELLFPSESLRTVAQMSRRLGTGARGLVSLVRNALDDVNWRLPDLQEEGVDRVVITPETVRRTGEPIVLRRDDPLPPEWADEVTPNDPKPHEEADQQRPPLPDINTLRASALHPGGVAAATPSAGSSPGITDTRSWSPARVARRLERVKKELDWPNTTGSARKWWEAFENENRTRTALVLRVAEELLVRKATITEFFLAYVYSNCDNIQGNLLYLDYTRIKNREVKKRKKRAQANSKPKPTDLFPAQADEKSGADGDGDAESDNNHEFSRILTVRGCLASKPEGAPEKSGRAHGSDAPPEGLDPRVRSCFRLRVSRNRARVTVSRAAGIASLRRRLPRQDPRRLPAIAQGRTVLRPWLGSKRRPGGRSRPGEARCAGRSRDT